MKISDFDYDLPADLIAQTAAEKRDGSRMLVVDRGSSACNDRMFADLPQFVRKGDLIVVNNTKVFPARLIGRSETGATVETFLVNETADGNWTVLARPAKRLHPGKRIIFDKHLSAVVIEKLPDGKVLLNFRSDGDFYDILNRIGLTPLPPYIKRDRTNIDTDRERYQTIYARERGAIAAPTAGLHFSPEMFDRLKDAGVEVAEITLHVGYATFEPVRAEDLADHRVSPESYRISDATADKLNSARSAGRRIVAIGTTTTRALESAAAETGRFVSGDRVADLTITPGYRFRTVDALLTNFHLPQSSLLVLTSSFGGHKLIMRSYRHAVSSAYRFYSYGDCMLIV